MIDFDKTLKATGISSITMVAYMIDEFPSKHGNCFSVVANNNDIYRIINFHYENLEELIRTKVIDFPITITPVEDSEVAIIADERIPYQWYSDYICPVCTPREYLLPTQRLQQILDIKRGKRVEKEVEMNGKKYIMVKIN